jgi:hypothetical protein
MDLKAIKELSTKFSVPELEQCASDLETQGVCTCSSKSDPADAMSDVLQALELVNIMAEKGMTQQEALREFSKRVRSVLS